MLSFYLAGRHYFLFYSTLTEFPFSSRHFVVIVYLAVLSGCCCCCYFPYHLSRYSNALFYFSLLYNPDFCCCFIFKSVYNSTLIILALKFDQSSYSEREIKKIEPFILLLLFFYILHPSIRFFKQHTLRIKEFLFLFYFRRCQLTRPY